MSDLCQGGQPVHCSSKRFLVGERRLLDGDESQELAVRVLTSSGDEAKARYCDTIHPIVEGEP